MKNVWDQEFDAKKEICLQRHLNKEDLFPDHWDKMDAGPVVRFFLRKQLWLLKREMNEGFLAKTVGQRSTEYVNNCMNLQNSRACLFATQNLDQTGILEYLNIVFADLLAQPSVML